MTDPTVLHTRFGPLLTYVGVCCREWTLMLGAPVGRCGLCGERPVAKEPDG